MLLLREKLREIRARGEDLGELVFVRWREIVEEAHPALHLSGGDARVTKDTPMTKHVRMTMHASTTQASAGDAAGKVCVRMLAFTHASIHTQAHFIQIYPRPSFPADAHVVLSDGGASSSEEHAHLRAPPRHQAPLAPNRRKARQKSRRPCCTPPRRAR
eukprot:6193792-Pleurochrysis_carterae.AAC.1